MSDIGEEKEIEELREVAAEKSGKEEEKARIQGWVAKEEFRGKPEEWIDAKVFNERGNTIVPIMRERKEWLEKEILEMKESFKEFSKFHKDTEERAYKKALQEIEKRKLAAVEKSDTDEYLDAESERVELEKNKPVLAPAKPAEPPEMLKFRETNDWYEIDSELTAEADALGTAYAKQNIPYFKILEKVQATIKRLHPEKFTNTKREGVFNVETEILETGIPSKNKNHSYSALPGEARKQCDKWVSQGLLTKEQYIKDYEW